MLLTPLNVTRFSRALLLALGLAAPGWLMAAYWRAPGPDGMLIGLVAHALGAYLFALLCFAALPRMRRQDLVFALVALSAVAGLVRTAGGTVFDPFALLSVTVGVAMAYLPAMVDRLRLLTRSRGRESFGAIHTIDRRSKLPDLAAQQRLRS